jgi:hypothetical protein
MEEVPFSRKSLRLLHLAQEEFGRSWQPTRAERIVLAAATIDEPADCVPSIKKDAKEINPEYAENFWGPERKVSAYLIRWLCTDHHALELMDPSGIEIDGAYITDGLNLDELVIPFALSLTSCSIAQKVVMHSLEIPSLRLDGSRVGSLNANGLRTKGDLSLRDGFHSQGTVQLIDARIGGQVDCSGGRFINSQRKEVPTSGIALEADGIVISGSLFFKNQFRAEGKVRLVGAQVGGNFECTRGEFVNPAEEALNESGIALFADSISVKGSIFLRAHCEGEVRFLDAHIGADLECDGATLINPRKDNRAKTGPVQNGGNALSLHRSTIGGDLFLTDGFRAEGTVSLRGARIEGHIYCSLGNFEKADLSLEDATTRFFGDFESRWPGQDMLHVNGFQYQVLYPLDAEKRLQWLNLQPDTLTEPFHTQPFLQLAKVLGNAGHEDGKTRVLIAMKDKEWAIARRGMFAQLWRWPFKVAAGYGYDPLKALWEILALSALGWVVYRRSYLAGTVVPEEQEAYEDFKKWGQPPDHHTKFAPLIYSLENSLPLVKLGQAEKWGPDPSPHNIPKSPPILSKQTLWPRGRRWLQKAMITVGLLSPIDLAKPRSRASRVGTSPNFVRWILWIQILLGWLLATLFLAGISGIIKKE